MSPCHLGPVTLHCKESTAQTLEQKGLHAGFLEDGVASSEVTITQVLMLTPVIPVTRKAELKKVTAQGQPRQAVLENLSPTKHQTKAGRVAQVEECLSSKQGPKFKLQYYQKEKRSHHVYGKSKEKLANGQCSA
jgi:hypothetical protein